MVALKEDKYLFINATSRVCFRITFNVFRLLLAEVNMFGLYNINPRINQIKNKFQRANHDKPQISKYLGAELASTYTNLSPIGLSLSHRNLISLRYAGLM